MKQIKLYTLYVTGNEREYLVEISHNPSLDMEFWYRRREYRRLVVCSAFIPFRQAYELLHQIASDRERKGVQLKERKSLHDAARQIGKKILKLGHEREYRELMVSNRQIMSPEELKKIRAQLSGRMLLPAEIRRALGEAGFLPTGDIEDALQLLYLSRYIRRIPGISTDGAHQVCMRCGESEILHSCPKCGDRCAVCESCREMGYVTECEALYVFNSSGLDAYPKRRVMLELPFDLTEPQKYAAAELLEFLKGTQKEALVWAACGAGKTEVSFPAMARVLSTGKKVLYATPRRDVVTEMEKRFRAAFPGVELAVLKGGSRAYFKKAQLLVATTHQVIRFYKAFDLVVLDEVDAFPYQGNRVLHRAVQRSRKPGGRIIYLTATPGKVMQGDIAAGKLKYLTIPSRHHGYPLPEPELVTLKGSSLEKVANLVYQNIEGEMCQLILFLPTILQAQEVVGDLRQFLCSSPYNVPSEWFQYSHSRDYHREEKCRHFREGKFPVLVCTSILERGINIPRVNVLVLHADRESIFDTSSLVQMAGRAGRFESYPGAKVWFMGVSVSPAMREAKAQIRMLNREAYERGYLRKEYYEGTVPGTN